jgi:hypothetical protein
MDGGLTVGHHQNTHQRRDGNHGSDNGQNVIDHRYATSNRRTRHNSGSRRGRGRGRSSRSRWSGRGGARSRGGRRSSSRNRRGGGSGNRSRNHDRRATSGRSGAAHGWRRYLNCRGGGWLRRQINADSFLFWLHLRGFGRLRRHCASRRYTWNRARPGRCRSIISHNYLSTQLAGSLRRCQFRISPAWRKHETLNLRDPV